MEIGERIKQRRIELGLTQRQIKQATGISSGNMSDLENGNRLPSTPALIALSDILNCSIDWILKGEVFKQDDTVFSNRSTGVALSENPSIESELLFYYFGMSADDQNELLMIAKMKYDKETKRLAEKEKAKSSLSKDEMLA